ncbi:MAG: glycosyltransferase, exosortase A system-associated [Burkholderiales bacterium]|nr:glycosyltransferase, exosortase A system-associated [Burkholderiales bacterium]
MSLRVLHILDHSLPLHSGYTFRTLSILREQRRLGWETFHLTSPKQGEAADAEETVEGWQFFRTSLAPGLRLRGVDEIRVMVATRRRIGEVIEKVRPHVVHPHSPVLNALPAISAARKHGLPVVYEMRASWEDAAVDHGTTTEGSLRYRASRALETLALRRADQVTTICDGLRNEIASRGVPASRITVIPNAVDIETFRAGAAPDPALRAQLGLVDSTVLGFAGSFYAYEGLDVLLDAVPLLLPAHPSLKVLLLGGGPEEARLKARADAAGIARHVLFVGRVLHQEVARYYDLIDILVYPRRSMRLTELVTPLKPLEAMAQGRLVAASDVGGHRELIRHGETGVLFEAGDAAALARAVTHLLADRAVCERLRTGGRRFVETERSWQRSVAGYVDVYRRLLPEPQQRLVEQAG